MTRTPEETLRHLLDRLLAKDMDAVADLWAPDGTAEFPFAVGASPRRLDGREAVRGYLAGYPDHYDVRSVPAVTVHTTGDPATIVVELTAEGRTVATGAAYRIDYVTVLTVEDGLITRFRDHWSPVAAAAAAGTLPEPVGRWAAAR
ncbi:nuclear transport factor 2 family protein [Pseudonocardia sp. HH130630-07]|uniref:nuclear transport factor 2 family protein n=1 Tax=Pseudonocardia sp. HH130630-07 TaxID=1690815 RepID=UPI00081521C0|nr:nuclear transport factor 2 family protein [Pseudonocardia sp. HH130630-07]ANY08979.1 hypothetical protein AFB00_24970 [Pseudonocardia sp. HH130630-07]